MPDIPGPSAFTPFLRRFTDERARDLTDTKELYRRVRALHLASPYADESATRDSGGEIYARVKDVLPDELDDPLGFALYDIHQLEKTIFQFPSLNLDIGVLSLKEQSDLRHFLRAKEHFLANERRIFPLFKDSLAYLFRVICQALPETLAPSPFVIPLISALPDPKLLMDNILGEFAQEKYKDAGLFVELFRQLYFNLCEVSGIADPYEPKKPFKRPSQNDAPLDEIVRLYFKGTPFCEFLLASIPLKLSYEDRYSHMHVLGGSGAGKTTLLQNLILHDLRSDDPPSLVIVDSQGDLIDKLSHLALFDPEYGPLASRFTLITPKRARLRVFDFANPDNNHFLCVRELWIKGALYRRRADIVGFVNGIPVLFMELKNVHRDLRRAYDENLADYKDTIPHVFEHNGVIVLGNGTTAKLGSLSSKYKHFREWKRLAEEEPGAVDMETLLRGICSKTAFLDLIENFILFDDSGEALVKVIAQNQQFLGVNRAIEAVRERKTRAGKLGVFWHTQGAGKSYSIAFFTRKVHRRVAGNFTFLILTDRDDLDTQIYSTFAGCGVVDNDSDPCRAGSGAELKAMLADAHKGYIFSLIQKFNQLVTPDDPYSTRDDIIVITDEAHRTQYGQLALNMRNALPSASYIGFTGTPLFTGDEITRRVFGDYISRYGFQRAVNDGATVPLYWDARGEKLGIAIGDLNERIAAKLEELEQRGEIDDINVAERLEQALQRDYHVITAEPRLDKIARDFVEHYSTEWESGKAMFVAIDKITTVRMHRLIRKYWLEKIVEFENGLAGIKDEQEVASRQRQIAWMRSTEFAVVISEEQGEIDKFRQWDLDIKPYRKLLKEGFVDSDGKRLSVEDAFKKETHPFRVAIVCAMWLTGFDVPSLATLYLDKPLKAHTLMQAIARANRVNEGKNNGLIVDYCGILKSLRKALATFAGSNGGEDDGEVDPVRPEAELLQDLSASILLVEEFLLEKGGDLNAVVVSPGFQRIAAIDSLKNLINENDETRKRFEVTAREVFNKFKACLTIKGVSDYRADVGAINIVYKSLQEDRDAADISSILRELHAVIEPAIAVKGDGTNGGRIYDISTIDFDRLRREFEKHPKKQTEVHNLKDAIEKRLARLLAANPLRTNFQQRYEKIVADYNSEKDRATIEATFEALMRLVGDLDVESTRAMREGLDEETLALFDLLKKPDLEKRDIGRIKKVAVELLAILKGKKQEIDDWRSKEQTRDEMRQAIHDFLYSDATGLPASYEESEIDAKAGAVFAHMYSMYA